MMAHALSTAMLAGMACDGLIKVAVDTVRAGNRIIKVRQLRITEAGLRALKGLTERRLRPE